MHPARDVILGVVRTIFTGSTSDIIQIDGRAGKGLDGWRGCNLQEGGGGAHGLIPVYTASTISSPFFCRRTPEEGTQGR